jgi:TolB-like protein/Tfp pilus assembly protein PilF/tRNA A-37 threonylcarbamoyl transferase component Bud32
MNPALASPEPEELRALAELVADGSPVDWNAAEAQATDGVRSVIRQLRIVDRLAAMHRSAAPDPVPGAAGAVRGLSPAASIGSWAHLDLMEPLGEGTLGQVYRAWDPHLEREVALKLLRVHETSDDLRSSRIAAEGRRLARIRHPNVITVHGVAVHEGRVGLWMELVRGATLEQTLATQGPFSSREAALVGIDLCRALASIHKAGLIHRDVKAQNVMRESGGRLVLMDLGTGCEIDRSGRHASHDRAGTPLYLAPEIFDGAAASECTDLYSLGVLLYHLVTGSFPVRAATLDQLESAHAAGRAVRLRDARPDLPTVFVSVVDRAIAADPDQRYLSAGEFETHLVRALEDSAAGTGHARRPAWWMAFAAAAALGLGLPLRSVPWSASTGQGVAAPVAPLAIRSIAVLPLTNMSGDQSQDYFADGMTEELIGTLGQLRAVKVISRTSTMRFKGTKLPLPDIARALHVDAVLEGSVLIAGGEDARRDHKRVRINARLIYAGTDTQLWDRDFEVVVEDVLALQSQVARAVADGIDLRLASQAQVRAQDFGAFDLYLKGRYYWNMRTSAGLKESVQYFQAAIERDRSLAAAYSGLADAYNMLAVYGFMARSDALSHAADAARRALTLDDTLGESHASLGYTQMIQFDWDAAEKSFTKAVQLKPGYATAHHWFASFLARRGRFPEALTEIREALALDPLSTAVNAEFGAILMLARRDDEAIAQLERAVQLDPSFRRTREVLVDAYAHAGRYSLALAEATRAAALGGDAQELRANLGFVYGRTGHRPEALAIARDLAGRSRRGEDGAAGAAASVYAALGNRDRAFEWLNRSYGGRESWVAYMRVDPKFDSLRPDPRFRKLLARVDGKR